MNFDKHVLVQGAHADRHIHVQILFQIHMDLLPDQVGLRTGLHLLTVRVLFAKLDDSDADSGLVVDDRYFDHQAPPRLRDLAMPAFPAADIPPTF